MPVNAFQSSRCQPTVRSTSQPSTTRIRVGTVSIELCQLIERSASKTLSGYPATTPGPSTVQPPTTGTVHDLEPRKTLKLSNTSLVAELKMIGEMAGYRVEVAPGFPDQQVSIDYDGFTTSDMLKDMGQRFGFTPFDQGDGTIIIVPAVDAGSMNPDSSGSNRRIGG